MEISASNLDLIFQTIADSTRRRVVEMLSKGPKSVSELAKPFGLAMPSFMQHLKMLEESGLVKSKKIGRVRTCTLDPKALKSMDHWLQGQKDMWELRLDQLDEYLLVMKKDERNKK